VVDLYGVQNPTPDRLCELVAAIRALLDATATEAELASRLERLGSCYVPTGNELAARQWLLTVERRLIDAADSLRAERTLR
jgi:hypothetical protein